CAWRQYLAAPFDPNRGQGGDDAHAPKTLEGSPSRLSQEPASSRAGAGLFRARTDMSSDIRKWFMKPHDKNAGAAKPSAAGAAPAAAKKPVLSIPEKAATSSVPGNQDASVRRKTSKYFAPKTEKDADVAEKSSSKRKLQKSSEDLEDDIKPFAANKALKDEEDDDDDFVAPSKKKTPVKPPPLKKLKAASNDDDQDERMDEDAETPSKAAGRGRGRGRGGRGAGAAHGKTTSHDDDGGEDRMDEDAKTPSKAA
uniref:Uncharacterized protein n=1 Tax=Aegilops tauschii subsp. strangulata TaxID=200361 RepID=A0A453SHM8_AEGTS